ncbi:MAG: hypothetical protein P1U68_15945 [Verrucomicrobiales bacterium]|nr:hypothetical protein [Verrucomicrobiales bacterium]
MTQPSSLLCSTLFTLVFVCTPVLSAEPTQADYYKITSIPAPDGVVIEGGSIEILPEGKIAVCTRRGQIWTLENGGSYPDNDAKWNLFAEYLHEPLGLAWKEGWLYAVQRPEVTRMKDEDGDGRADIFETVSDAWGINGNYHEYTFGSRFDKEGFIWAPLCLTGSFTANSLYRGWVLRINEDGRMIPTASGVRSPGGIGFNADGDVFYTDNQGAWNGSSSLKWVKPGSFQGNPNGNIWYDFTDGAIGKRPIDPPYTKEGSRTVIERENIPELVPPAVIFPHQKVGNSPTGIEADMTNGKFGPFAGQVFVGEQTHSKVHRIFLEKVNGLYQGAMFPFLEGFQSGNIGLRLSEDGKLFTSGSNRGWGARGGKSFAFERVDWTGETPFEIHEMRALSDGFELTFTKPIDPATAVDTSFKIKAYTYIYQKAYGSPEVDPVTPTVSVASVAKDGLSLKLKVTPLTKGHVHELHAEGLTDRESRSPLLHREAYYTLNEIPE